MLPSPGSPLMASEFINYTYFYNSIYCIIIRTQNYVIKSDMEFQYSG